MPLSRCIWGGVLFQNCSLRKNTCETRKPSQISCLAFHAGRRRFWSHPGIVMINHKSSLQGNDLQSNRIVHWIVRFQTPRRPSRGSPDIILERASPRVGLGHSSDLKPFPRTMAGEILPHPNSRRQAGPECESLFEFRRMRD